MAKTRNLPADTPPELLILQIGSPVATAVFNEMFSDLRKRIETSYTVTTKTSIVAAQGYLFTRKPRVILVTDGGLGEENTEALALQLSAYMQQGGAVILACNFVSFLAPPKFDRFFKTLGLPWTSEETITKHWFFLNLDVEQVFGRERFQALDVNCYMRGVWLHNVPANACISTPDINQYNTGYPGLAWMQVCSAAFARIGRGYLGYCGDIENNPSSETLLMTMLETASELDHLPYLEWEM